MRMLEVPLGTSTVVYVRCHSANWQRAGVSPVASCTAGRQRSEVSRVLPNESDPRTGQSAGISPGCANAMNERSAGSPPSPLLACYSNILSLSLSLSLFLSLSLWIRVKILNSKILEWLTFRIWKLTNIQM